MTEVTAAQAKMYSKDGKLWVNMTQREAYKDDKLLELFTFADANGDKVLDKDEISRYNGPTINVYGEGDFYPGLKLENVSQRSLETFKEIDIAPKDGVIQDSEINEYIDKDKKSSKKYAIIGGVLGALIGANVADCMVNPFAYAGVARNLSKTLKYGLAGAVVVGLMGAYIGWNSLEPKTRVQHVAS